MPAWSLDEDRAVYEVAHVENALRDGFPIGPGLAGHMVGAIREAADRMGINDQSLRRRIGTPERPGAIHRRYGLTVDWGLYRERPQPPVVPDQQSSPINAQQEAPPDPVAVQRRADAESALRSELKDLRRRLGSAEDIRTSVLGLTQEPLKPRLVIPSGNDDGHGGRTVILHLSDVHYGETVDIEEMDGANRYDVGVARARLGRFFNKSAALMTEYWAGPPPEEIILCLGGDLISGDIHPELAQTNAPAVPATVREVGEHVAGGLVALRTKVGVPIRVYSVPGNHGRMTMKPQSKGRAAGSLDLLATDFAEATFRGAGLDGVSWYRTASPDAHFSTYGWHWLLNHGDSMGGRGGGSGFIGPMASIIKGHRKLVDTSWRSGRPVHFVLTAHYHTTGKTAFGWANGSVCGYGEYARDLRADPEPARQNMLVVHPRHGVINEQPLYLGVPSEGSHYQGPASVVRPQWDDAA
jgi:hypothetical protein